MTVTLSVVLQILVILSSGLFFMTLAHSGLNSNANILGLSRFAFLLILGLSPWLLTNTPNYVNLYFSLLAALISLIFLAAQYVRNGKATFNPVVAAIPLLALVFLKSQPYFLTFFYTNILLSGVSIGLGILALLYIRKLKFGRFFMIYLSLQVLALLVCAVNINDWTLMSAVCILIFSDVLGAFFIHRDIQQFYASINSETSIYREQFEEAVEKEVRKRTFYVELSKERMAEMNRTDHLTKLLNRKAIISDIEGLILDKHTTKFALFVFDIDYFKKINDTLGHTTGDVCLKTLAGILKSNAREYDLLGRFGGDEFIIALPMLGYKEGMAFGQRLMEQIYMHTDPRFTISMGMSVYPWDGESYKQLFEIADKGLYLAKEQGRNRIGYKGYIKA